MDPCEQVPAWLLRPLPAYAAVDDKLHGEIDKLAAKLPQSLAQIGYFLNTAKMYREYDAAANRACAHVWLAREQLFGSPLVNGGPDILTFATDHMVEAARARIYRVLARDPDHRVRARVRDLVESGDVHEVALPATPDGHWDATGWLRGPGPARLAA